MNKNLLSGIVLLIAIALTGWISCFYWGNKLYKCKELIRKEKNDYHLFWGVSKEEKNYYLHISNGVAEKMIEIKKEEYQEFFKIRYYYTIGIKK